MPKTKQDVADRKGWVQYQSQKDQDKIADTSPDSESKAQMKEKMYQRQRVAIGDLPGRADKYYADKPSGNPDMKKGGRVKKMARGGGIEQRGKTKGRFV